MGLQYQPVPHNAYPIAAGVYGIDRTQSHKLPPGLDRPTIAKIVNRTLTEIETLLQDLQSSENLRGSATDSPYGLRPTDYRYST